MDYILELKNISKSFSNVTVVDEVSLNVKKGEVHALMGENGAGKSTLMKILMGIYKAEKGSISFEDKTVAINSPHDAISLGISMIHQELNPILDMEIAENIFIGREITSKNIIPIKLIDKKAMRAEASKLFKEMGIDINPKSLTRNLSVAQIQLVEIVKAISLNAKVIIMDEPTSAITEKEVVILFKQIERLKNQGVSIIYISHKMDEIFKIADRITILRDGKLVGTGPCAEFSRDKLISLMVGREIREIYPKADAVQKDVLLSIDSLSRTGKIHDISFSLKGGEILGIAGLVGAGRSELAETIFGIYPATSGKIFIKGKEVKIKTPNAAIKEKIALITEDRKQTGLNLKFSVEKNISQASIKKVATRGIISKSKEEDVANKYIGDLKIKTNSKNSLVSSLSGGNQQKVVLGKWLFTDPEIIILDEPTRGIDVGAKRDIYILIGELAKAGKGVMVISSEMPEIMGICDRILVMCGGTVTGELDRSEFTQEKIMQYASASGGTKNE